MSLRKEKKTRYSDQERKKMELLYAYLDGKHCNYPHAFSPTMNYAIVGHNYDGDALIEFSKGFVDGLDYRKSA